MDRLFIEILNPKARKLLEDLAELDLIIIQDLPKDDFAVILEKLRVKADGIITLDEITAEVELVRSKRYTT